MKYWERPDVILLAGRYALRKYTHDSTLRHVRNLQQSEETINQIKSVYGNYVSNESNIIISLKPEGDKLTLPARGEFCTHSESVNFTDLFIYVANKGKCPICYKDTEITQIIIDTYLHGIIELIRSGIEFNSDSDVSFISINRENLQWAVVENSN